MEVEPFGFAADASLFLILLLANAEQHHSFSVLNALLSLLDDRETMCRNFRRNEFFPRRENLFNSLFP